MNSILQARNTVRDFFYGGASLCPSISRGKGREGGREGGYECLRLMGLICAVQNVVLQSVIILMYKNMGVPVYLSVCLSVCVNNIIWSHGDCCQLPFLL